MADDVILETRGLTKEFKGFVAVKNVSLNVRRGSIHALIGPNGAGKTTCFNLLTQFLEPTRGQILFKGREITGSAPARIARMGLVRSFQISAVFPHLTVLENVRIALQRKRGALVRFLALGDACWTRWTTRARELHRGGGSVGVRGDRSRSSCPTAASARWRSPPRSRSIRR